MAEIKFSAGVERKRLKDVIPLETPYAIYFFPTNVCNFRCVYCAHSGGAKQFEAEYGMKPESMSLETFKRAIDQLKDFPDKLKVLNLSGQGEPLLNKNIVEMIRYAKQKDVAERIELISNASMLNHELSRQLVEAGLDCIRISLQGMTSAKYKEICGYTLSMEAFIEEIEFLYRIKGKCDVFVKIMDIALEEGEEEKFYRTFETISDRMFIERCKPVYDGVTATQGIRVDTDRYGREHKPRMVCPLPFYMLGILPDGTVSPCETIYVPQKLGNVWNTSLREIWNGEELKSFQQMQMNRQRRNNLQCARCCAPDDVSHPEDDLDG